MHVSLQARLELSMAVNDTEETAHLGKEKRLLDQLLYEASQKSVLATQLAPFPELIQSCEDQYTLFVQSVQQEFQNIEPHEQTLESFIGDTCANSRKLLT